MTKREIARVVRRSHLGEVDERAERRSYWTAQSVAARFCEVEALRRMWTEITGDPDRPIKYVVHRRRLGDPAITRPGESTSDDR